MFAQPEDRAKFEEVLKKFNKHCMSKKNETYERYVFCLHFLHQGDSFDNFLTNFKIKAQSCNFGDFRGSMIGDQILFGTNEKKLQENMLRETNPTGSDFQRACSRSNAPRKRGSECHVRESKVTEQI